MAGREEHPTEPERSEGPTTLVEDYPQRPYSFWINPHTAQIWSTARPVPHTGELPPQAGDDDGPTA